MKAILRAPGLCDRGWVLTPPSWPCHSLPPRLYGWMGSQGMGRKSSMWPHLPTYAPTIGGLLTIPNPRLCFPIKLAYQGIQPMQCTIWLNNNICKLKSQYMLPSGNFNFQWKLISFFQCRRLETQYVWVRTWYCAAKYYSVQLASLHNRIL